MRLRLRRGVFTSLLLLLAVFAFLFSRLDAQQLQQAAASQVWKITGLTMQSGKPSLSLLHGVSLKLPELRIGKDGDTWRLIADVVRIDVSLWSLVSGDLHFSAIDVVHPQLHVSRVMMPQTLLAMDLPDQIDKLRIRKGVLLVADKTLAEDVLLVVRRIAREKQTTWELQSRFAGGDFSGQGYVRFGDDGKHDAFGRLSASKLKINQLPAISFPTLHYDSLSASLTFSVSADQQWKWSGNIESHDKHNQLPDLTWRGKIIGKTSQDFQLRDSQLTFGKGNRLQVFGGCPAGDVCAFKITTRNADAQRLLNVLGVEKPFHAALDGTMHLKQKNSGWQLAAALDLQHVRWGDVDLPDAKMKLEKMYMNSMDDFDVFQAKITPGKEKGEILLKARRRGKDHGFVSVTLKRLDTVWVQIGNIALDSSELKSAVFKPRLAGEGLLGGTVDWTFSPGKSQFGFKLDAKASRVALGDFFKPAGVQAGLTGHYRVEAKQRALSIGEAQLGHSFLKKAEWRISGNQRLVSVADGHVDFAELRASGVKLPGLFDGWHGSIEGAIDDFPLFEHQSVLNKLAASSGALLLHEFGIGDAQWNGKIVLKKGTINTPALHWQQGDEFADFSAHLDANSMRGQLDIMHGRLAWVVEGGFPDFLASLQLHGKFSNLDLIWDENLWQGMHGIYLLKNGKLALKKVRGAFAGGYFQSRKMKIIPFNGGMDFDGRVQMSAVYLEKINGLANGVGADMHGYIFFNGLIGGHFPLGAGAAWHGNGDIEIHKGRWNQAKAAHLILWRPDSGHAKPATGEGFSRLMAHYRFTGNKLELSHLRFNKADLQAEGAATVGLQGNIRGRLHVHNKEQAYVTDISGRWPSAASFFAQEKTAIDGKVKH